jgi:hypothetical protein
MPPRTADPGAVPVMMTGMARVTGTTAALSELPAAVRAEMADLCDACPRTDACRQWLAMQLPGSALPQPDLCPNHATFAALSARSPPR